MDILWKIFGSHKHVVNALIQSKGYDMTPQIVQMPVNDDTVVQMAGGLAIETEQERAERLARLSE